MCGCATAMAAINVMGGGVVRGNVTACWGWGICPMPECQECSVCREREQWLLIIYSWHVQEIVILKGLLLIKQKERAYSTQ